MATKYLQVQDVVGRYGGALSSWTIYELARTGRIPHRKHVGGKRLLFAERELDLWDDGAPLEVRQLPRGGRVVRPVENHTAPRQRRAPVSKAV